MLRITLTYEFHSIIFVFDVYTILGEYTQFNKGMIAGFNQSKHSKG